MYTSYQYSNELSDKYSKEEHALYNLIRENTICSHMKPALYQVQTITLTTPDTNHGVTIQSPIVHYNTEDITIITMILQSIH